MAFPEMSLSEVAPEDVPATYFVAVQVSERRQSVGLGRGGGPASWPLGGACPKKAPPIRVFLIELRNYDALSEFRMFQESHNSFAVAVELFQIHNRCYKR